jgi:hypothetical protein
VSLPGFEASASIGVGAPRSTPTWIIDRLNYEINAMLADPKMKARLADLGAEVLALSRADFGKLPTEETEKWAKVIKFAVDPESERYYWAACLWPCKSEHEHSTGVAKNDSSDARAGSERAGSGSRTSN